MAHDLLYELQISFRPSYSTKHALLALLKKIIDAFESKKTLLVVLMDLSKACDMLNHAIPLDKLEELGINRYRISPQSIPGYENQPDLI